MSGRRARAAGGLGTPLLVVPPAVVGVAFLVLPTIGLLVRTPWRDLGAIYRDQHIWTALRLSLESAVWSTLISFVVGVPIAWMLARFRVPAMSVVRAVVVIPLVLPPVIGGVAIFAAFGRNGMLGQPIRGVFGQDLPFTFAAVVAAQVFVSMPFLVVTVEGAFRTADQALEEAAATLGASRTRIFLAVTLPLVAPSLVAGSVLCYARSLGEFGATLLVGGNTDGVTRTLPTAVLTVFGNDPSQAPALSLPLMAVAIVVLGALRDRWLRPVAA